jgi:hypothetical protein
MTSTTAMESKVMTGSQTDDKLHRGRNVVLAFLMQGTWSDWWRDKLTFRLGTSLQSGHVDCPAPYLPSRFGKPSVSRRIVVKE